MLALVDRLPIPDGAADPPGWRVPVTGLPLL